MDQVFTGGFAARVFTSLWVRYRLNDQLARCPACNRLLRVSATAESGPCQCGAGEVQLSSFI